MKMRSCLYKTTELDMLSVAVTAPCLLAGCPPAAALKRTPRLQKDHEAARPTSHQCSHVFRGQVLLKLQLFGPTSRYPDSSAPQFTDYLYLGTTSIKNCYSFCSLSEYPHIKLAPQEIAYLTLPTSHYTWTKNAFH